MPCNDCNVEKYDILRTNINIGGKCKPCDGECLDDCDVKPECNCPNGPVLDKCVYYTGCEKFITQINPGMTFDQVVDKIEQTFHIIDKKMEEYEDEIFALRTELNKLLKKDEYGSEYEDCYSPVE